MIMGDLCLSEIKNFRGRRSKKYLCERRDVTDEVLWVRNTLDVDCLGLFIDGSGEGFWSLFCYPLDADPIMLERHF